MLRIFYSGASGDGAPRAARRDLGARRHGTRSRASPAATASDVAASGYICRIVNGNRFHADVALLPPRPRPRRAKTRSPSPPRSPPTSPPRWLRSPNLLAAGTSLDSRRRRRTSRARRPKRRCSDRAPRRARRSTRCRARRRSCTTAARCPPSAARVACHQRAARSRTTRFRGARAPPVPPQAVLDAAWLMLTGAAPADDDDDNLAVVGAGPGPQALRLSRRPLSRSASAPAEELFGWVRR